MTGGTLTPELLHKMDAYWRAASDAALSKRKAKFGELDVSAARHPKSPE